VWQSMIIADTQMMNWMHENDNLQLNGPQIERPAGHGALRIIQA